MKISRKDSIDLNHEKNSDFNMNEIQEYREK